ncbi:ribbon-helix-helix domain-containing protein, partial [Lactiplantibacillus plantarum]|uniref:ribbon-helix-helix domain-containing protein n=3 Tax=Lactiplantibacillus TaxID=2767842 RepID=UPI002000F1CA
LDTYYMYEGISFTQDVLRSRRKEVERKRSVTFSITESQLKKMDAAARKNGFKNRSEFLASIIDAI